jgi:hypothetical protein
VIVQFRVLWQLLQSCVVLTWWICLPVAVTPLWQLWHIPLIPTWLNVTAFQSIVLWQAPQSWVVWICCAGFPADDAPLWQLTQLANTPR